MVRKRKADDDNIEQPQTVRRSGRLKSSQLSNAKAPEEKREPNGDANDKIGEENPDDKLKSTKRRKTQLSQPQKNKSKVKDNVSQAPEHKTNTPSPKPRVEDNSSGSSYWLMKAEPESRIENGIDVKFSIDDLKACTEPEPWEGVRNHVAKNNMIAMKKADLAFFYHSNCKTPGIAGVMEILEESSVDKSAFDKNHPYYDPKSDPSKPRWFHVHVGFVRKFPRFVPLKELQSYKNPGQPLENMQLHKQSRLSVSKVSEKEWKFITNLAENEPES